MKVVIVGYGSMGREVERALLERNHTIVARVDPGPVNGDVHDLDESLLRSAEVAIEFGAGAGVVQNAQRYAGAGIAAVVGTTGWEGSRDAVRKLVEESGIAYLWGANFSIGAHLFFELVEDAARLIDSLPQYDIMMFEAHHNRKKDSPSGTALTAAARILAASSRKRRIVDTKLDRQIEPDELHVASLRGGSHPGLHSVIVDSPADTVEITHTARNRSGFAVGAVLAAEWLVAGRKRGFLRVEEFIQELLKERKTK